MDELAGDGGAAGGDACAAVDGDGLPVRAEREEYVLGLQAAGAEEADGEGLFSAHDVGLGDVLAGGVAFGRGADAGDQCPGEVSAGGERGLEDLYACGQLFEAGGDELMGDLAEALLRGDHAGADDEARTGGCAFERCFVDGCVDDLRELGLEGGGVVGVGVSGAEVAVERGGDLSVAGDPDAGAGGAHVYAH